MTNHIFIEEITRADLSIINKWRNNPELIQFLSAPFRFINIETDENWFEIYMKNRSSQVRCSIRDQKSYQIIGLISLTDIDFINRSAEIHIQIGDTSHQEVGIGTIALNQMLSHGYLNLNLNRIYAHILASNDRSVRLFHRAKFQTEGVLREAIFKQGNYQDLLVLSLLRKEFSK